MKEQIILPRKKVSSSPLKDLDSYIKLLGGQRKYRVNNQDYILSLYKREQEELVIYYYVFKDENQLLKAAGNPKLEKIKINHQFELDYGLSIPQK